MVLTQKQGILQMELTPNPAPCNSTGCALTAKDIAALLTKGSTGWEGHQPLNCNSTSIHHQEKVTTLLRLLTALSRAKPPGTILLSSLPPPQSLSATKAKSKSGLQTFIAGFQSHLLSSHFIFLSVCESFLSRSNIFHH